MRLAAEDPTKFTPVQETVTALTDQFSHLGKRTERWADLDQIAIRFRQEILQPTHDRCRAALGDVARGKGTQRNVMSTVRLLSLLELHLRGDAGASELSRNIAQSLGLTVNHSSIVLAMNKVEAAGNVTSYQARPDYGQRSGIVKRYSLSKEAGDTFCLNLTLTQLSLAFMIGCDLRDLETQSRAQQPVPSALKANIQAAFYASQKKNIGLFRSLVLIELLLGGPTKHHTMTNRIRQQLPQPASRAGTHDGVEPAARLMVRDGLIEKTENDTMILTKRGQQVAAHLRTGLANFLNLRRLMPIETCRMSRAWLLAA